MFLNIVVGKPMVDPKELLSENDDVWENVEKPATLFTETKWLPAIMKEAGIVQSTGEVKRNRPELCIELNKPDCFWLKWGKKKLYVIVGGDTEGVCCKCGEKKTVYNLPNGYYCLDCMNSDD